MAVFLTLSMLLVSASGCLGLLQSREYMEQLRGDVDLATTIETTVVEHAFTNAEINAEWNERFTICLLYTSPSPRDGLLSRMPSSA